MVIKLFWVELVGQQYNNLKLERGRYKIISSTNLGNFM